MPKRRTPGSVRLILPAAVIVCVAVTVLSAVAASVMYRPNPDSFTASLGRNLALLCSNSDCGLSRTQLYMIENANVRSIRYDEGTSGQKMFFARLAIGVPKAAGSSYGLEPADYLKKTAQTIAESGSYEECEIIGLCRDNAPVVDKATVSLIAEAAGKAWEKETVSTDSFFQRALIDAVIPEPFTDRVFTDGGTYQALYSEWLDDCARRFAAEGLTVTVNGSLSGDASDIRAVMEQIITPYLCSVRNISVSRSQKSGLLTLSFDSLDVIGTLSAASKPSFSALNKMSGVYSDSRALKVTVDVDLCEIADTDGRFALPYFNIIRAMTRYGSTIGTSTVKIKMPTSPQVIDGQSDGQWPVEFKRTKGDGNVIVNVLRIEDSGAETSVLKLFLTDGGKITVCLGKGRYRLNMAIGTTYYGGKELFGANGIYFRDTENIYYIPSKDLKTVTVKKHAAESLSFRNYLLKQGINKSLIDKSQF